MEQSTIDFIGIVNDNCPTRAIEEDYSKLFLLEAALKGDKSLIADISDDRFNLMQAVSARIHDKEEDLEYIVCSLINEEFQESDSRLNWMIKLFNSTEVEANRSELQNKKPVLKVRLLNQWHGANINQFGIIKEILEEKFTVQETQLDDYDAVIDGVFGYKEIRNNKSFKIFFTGEAKPAKLEGYDISLGFEYELSDANNYLRLPLYYLYFGDLISSSYKRESECNPNKPYFSCFLVSNGKAEHRNNIFHELSSYKIVTSGGPHLNNIGRVIPENETYSFLSQCKFVIAYENNNRYPGYITEKLFQAYFAGSIPIYSSHPLGQQDINQAAVIVAQAYNSTDEMINYIIELDNDDQKYCDVWEQPIITDIHKNYDFIKDKLRKKMRNFFK